MFDIQTLDYEYSFVCLHFVLLISFYMEWLLMTKPTNIPGSQDLLTH